MVELTGAFTAIVLGSGRLMGFVVAQRSGQLQRASGDNQELAERAKVSDGVARRGGAAPNHRRDNFDAQWSGDLTPDLGPFVRKHIERLATANRNEA